MATRKAVSIADTTYGGFGYLDQKHRLCRVLGAGQRAAPARVLLQCRGGVMCTRQKGRVYLRWIGPADRLHGEFRGQPVELIGTLPNAEYAQVRFPDGSVSLVSWDHLTDAPFRIKS